MQQLTVTNLPIYLPFDKAPLPFGDPLVSTVTIAAPGVVTTVGYAPNVNDAVAFSTTGALPTGLVVGTKYYVVSPSGNTYQVAATKGGAAITTTGTQSGVMTVHLLNNQVDGTTAPFKSGASVLVYAASAGLILQGAADTTGYPSALPYGQPAGPGTWNTIATSIAGFVGPVAMNYDWIRVSTAATVNLIQN